MSGGGAAGPLARLAVAPMVRVTTRHWRVLARMLTRRTMLYTPMVVDRFVLSSTAVKMAHSLGFHDRERPLGLQIASSGPSFMADALERVLDHGYEFDEINFNCGCPASGIVGGKDNGKPHSVMGAALFADPALVGAIMRAADDVVGATTPLTVKCRTGLGSEDSLDGLSRFVETVAGASSVRHFIVHARSAILDGVVGPKGNLEVPPLRHEYVYALKERFPDMFFSLNGGVKSLDSAAAHLERGADSVMLGRAAQHDMWGCLKRADEVVYGEAGPATGKTREQVALEYADFLEDDFEQNASLRYNEMLAPIQRFFTALPGARDHQQVMHYYATKTDLTPAQIIRRLVARRGTTHERMRMLKDIVDDEEEEDDNDDDDEGGLK